MYSARDSNTTEFTEIEAYSGIIPLCFEFHNLYIPLSEFLLRSIELTSASKDILKHVWGTLGNRISKANLEGI